MRKPRKKRRQRSALIEITNAILTLFIIVILLFGAAFIYMANSFYAKGEFSEDVVFTVKKGEGLGAITKDLQRQGLISNSLIFQIAARTQNKERAIKAGEFLLKKNSSMADILRELTEGKPITYSVTIAEGYSSYQVVQRLLENKYLTGEISEIPPEGSLLPDTYIFERGESREKIIQNMQAAFQEELDKVWQNRDADLPIKTKEELVILASLIEKETGIPSERAEVAGVFVNRLKKGMKLQTDPSVIYGITLGREKLGRGLRQSELDRETPYNTYKIDGLPIGPIANPGRESLKAAANPAKTDNLFFVAAGAYPSDGHLFATNYEEHRRNVALYREAVAKEEKRLREEAQKQESEQNKQNEQDEQNEGENTNQ